MNYDALESKLIHKLVHTRRDFHTYLESAWLESRMTSIIAHELELLGYNVKAGHEVIDKDSIMGRPSEKIIPENITRALSQGANSECLTRVRSYTGILAELDTNIDGTIIALRFDIDCVEVNEDDSESHRPNHEKFSSVNYGLMHACGYDAHMAIGLRIS